jgi:hypothetical protein
MRHPNQHQPGQSQQEACHLVRMPALMQPPAGQQQRKKRLRLQNQRGQTRGHAHMDGAEQKRKLTDRYRQPISQIPAQRHAGCLKQEQSRKCRQHEAQCPKQQWRDADDADFDDGKVDTPDPDDEQSQRQVFGSHGQCAHALASAVTGLQPCGLNTRSVDAGLFTSLAAGRTGRRTSSPPQLGQWPCRWVSAQSAQKVHSNEQMRASCAAGGRSRLQHSQLGRS